MIAVLASGCAVACMLVALAARATIARSARRYSRAVVSLTEQRLADLFVFLDARRVLRASLAAMLGVAALGTFTSRPWLILLALAVPLAPQAGYRWLRRRRHRRIAAQLPDASLALAAALRSGSSLPQALGTLATRQARPIAQEFDLLTRKQRLGVPLDQALAEFAERVPGPEAALFVAAVRIARELGGNLAETLERLGEALRRKLALEARIRALTSQGKIQGLVVGLLPLFLLWVLTLLEPEAMKPLFATPGGWAVLGVLAVLETVGFLLIRRIVRIEV